MLIDCSRKRPPRSEWIVSSIFKLGILIEIERNNEEFSESDSISENNENNNENNENDENNLNEQQNDNH